MGKEDTINSVVSTAVVNEEPRCLSLTHFCLTIVASVSISVNADPIEARIERVLNGKILKMFTYGRRKGFRASTL
eukprot:3351393-Ditylum_brightwellii.AAC.1